MLRMGILEVGGELTLGFHVYGVTLEGISLHSFSFNWVGGENEERNEGYLRYPSLRLLLQRGLRIRRSGCILRWR